MEDEFYARARNRVGAIVVCAIMSHEVILSRQEGKSYATYASLCLTVELWVVVILFVIEWDFSSCRESKKNLQTEDRDDIEEATKGNKSISSFEMKLAVFPASLAELSPS